jgi:transcription-repair coupling factor (superfamily II helicase)
MAGKMIGYFVSDQQSDYYKSNRFMAVMHFVQNTAQFVK